MYFHSVHGKNIELSSDFSQAKRSSGFCQGITFSSSPLTQLQRVTFMVEKIPQSSWTGNLRIGLTSINPATLLSSELADFSYPTLCNTDSYWIACVKKSYVKPSNRLTIVLDKNNSLYLEINNVVKATLFDKIATSVQKLWLLLDIYGSTGTVQFLPSDETPYEIKKRGLDAVNNFHSACVTGGSKPIYKTMLLIVGQDNDAKKNLKFCLVNSNQKQKMKFGLSASFRVKIEESVWQLKTGRYTKKINSTISRSKSNDSFYHTNRTRYTLEKSNSVDSIDDNCANSETSDEQDSDTSNDSDDDLYQIEELDEPNQSDIDPNDMKQDPSGNSYRQIAVNIYRELYKNSIFDRIQSILTDKDNLSFNQDLILKIAIEEFESSLYSHLPCRKILLLFYKQVVLNEIKLIKFKSMGSTITVKSMEEYEPNELEKITKNRLSLTISSIADQTYQILYSSRAIYLVCFDLTKDFNEPVYSCSFSHCNNHQMTYIEYFDILLKSIHSHTAKVSESNSASDIHSKIRLDQNLVINFKYSTLLPPIIIVGTNKNNLSDQEINRKFDYLKEFISTKIYANHVIEPFIPLDDLCQCDSYTNDSNIYTLKRLIEVVAYKEPYMGEQQPVRWMKFEKSLDKLKQKGLFYASLSQICELAHEKDIRTQEELSTCLNFLNDLGTIIYYGNANDIFLRNTIILRPFKLIEIFNKVLYASATSLVMNAKLSELWEKFDKHGILEDRLLDAFWKDEINQKPGLMGLMKKFDLICEKTGAKENFSICREYLVPSRATVKYNQNNDNPIIRFNTNQNFNSDSSMNESSFIEDVSDFGINSFQKNRLRLDANNVHVVEFFYDFCGFFTEILFHRIITRTARWTLMKNGSDVNKSVKLYSNTARFYLDEKHDFVIELAPIKYARIKIQIIRIDDEESEHALPVPNSCAKVRNFLETVLIDLKNMWVKRLKFNACVQCHCGKMCHLHQQKLCSHNECIHFLNLDECLTNNIVNCDFRRVKTLIYQSWFPIQNISLHKGPVLNAVKSFSDKNMYYEENSLPNWVKNVAKMLKTSKDETIKVVQNENDWLALARLLGYSKSRISYFSQSDNPPLQLICDWIMSSDNTNLTIEFLINYLEQINRDDVIKVINNERDKETVNSSVFISYQWDSQELVVKIREHLEKAGFNCFMDIGQIGGGNLLYQKIDEAIRNAKVVVACITPKFVVSHYCNREMALADLLRKPIVPIMLTATPWPPPGGMGLIFSQLVYVDYFGVGGHGGCGIVADREQRNNEIVAMIARHVNPSSYFLMNIDLNKDEKKSKKKLIESLKSSRANPYESSVPNSIFQNTNQISAINQSSSVPRDQDTNSPKCLVCRIV